MNTLETIIRRAKRSLGLSSHSAFIRLLGPGYDSLLNILYRSRGLERTIPGEEPVRIFPAIGAFPKKRRRRYSQLLSPAYGKATWCSISGPPLDSLVW